MFPFSRRGLALAFAYGFHCPQPTTPGEDGRIYPTFTMTCVDILWLYMNPPGASGSGGSRLRQGLKPRLSNASAAALAQRNLAGDPAKERSDSQPQVCL